MAGENIGAPVAATDDDNDTLTYSLDVTSLATFDIVATTGQLQTKAALDYETGTISYTVTVTAVDPSGADDTITVTITVNNVDEAGTVTLSSTQPVEEIRLTATLDDPDDVSGSATWSWARSPNGTSSWTRISGATSASYTPVPADVGRYLRATASYDDDESAGKSALANRVQPAVVFASGGRGQGHRPRGRHSDLLPGRRRRGVLRHWLHYGPVARPRPPLDDVDEPPTQWRAKDGHGPAARHGSPTTIPTT